MVIRSFMAPLSASPVLFAPRLRHGTRTPAAAASLSPASCCIHAAELGVLHCSIACASVVVRAAEVSLLHCSNACASVVVRAAAVCAVLKQCMCWCGCSSNSGVPLACPALWRPRPSRRVVSLTRFRSCTLTLTLCRDACLTEGGRGRLRAILPFSFLRPCFSASFVCDGEILVIVSLGRILFSSGRRGGSL